MGICHTKKSIEEIIHTKYKLAKDSTKKLNTREYKHVYVWKYSSDDLTEKEVRFYDTENSVVEILRRDNENVNNEGKENNGEEGKYKVEHEEYLVGEPLEWPIKANADEGYIILTIHNNTEHLKTLTSNNHHAINKPTNSLTKQYLHHLHELKLPLELIEILYMIKLDSFRQYYYTKLEKESYECEFEAEIEIIVGDLVERMECLKLVNIAYELEKYIRRGGQNVMKMFYNEYEKISYLEESEGEMTQNNINNFNNNNNRTFEKTTTDREVIVESRIPFERIFANEIARVMVSENYQTEEQRENEIDKLFYEFGEVMNKFNAFRDILFGRLSGVGFREGLLLKNKENNSMKKYKKYTKTHIDTETATKIIEQLKETSSPLSSFQITKNEEKEPINVFITTNLKNINNNLTASPLKKYNTKNNEIDQFSDLKNIGDDENNFELENDISIIEKPSNGQKKTNDFGYKKNEVEIRENKNFMINKKTNKNDNNMDISSPFICEITEIDGGMGNFDMDNDDNDEGDIREKGKHDKMMRSEKKEKIKTMVLQQQGNVGDESLFLPKELEELQVNKTIYELNVGLLSKSELNQEQQQLLSLPVPPLLITTYPGSSQFQEIQKRNVSLIINLSPWECYNYFINDIGYDWYWVEKLEERLEDKSLQDIDEQDRWRYNIECLIKSIVYRIETHLEQMSRQQQEEQQNNLALSKQNHPNSKVLIFCSQKNMIYSGLVAVGYLMLSNSYREFLFNNHRLTFNDALEVVTKSTNRKFKMPKVYEEQLRMLEARVNEISSTVNLNTLNTKALSSYRAYEVGLYTDKDLCLIVGRYVHFYHYHSKEIGELSTSNQLQTLPNNQLKSYFLIPNNLTSIIVKSINILREDASLMNSNNFTEKIMTISKLIKNMGLTLRVFYGKDLMAEQKKAYFEFIKQELLGQLVRYEYTNFTKKIFNVQKYKGKIELIIEALKELITSELIEKSFRKPQSFDQDLLTVVNDMNLLTLNPMIEKSHRQEPFNSKETLTFKYPILRPIFESKKKDSYYFMIKKFMDDSKKEKEMGCNVTFYKGDGWIGLEEDKERYFERIVHEYLKDVHEERIWIEDEESNADQSLFDRESILF